MIEVNNQELYRYFIENYGYLNILLSKNAEKKNSETAEN